MQAISSARQGIATLCRRSLVQFPRREARDVSTTSEPGVNHPRYVKINLKKFNALRGGRCRD